MPGAPLLTELAARFGERIILADGSLDRAGLAAIASTDDESVAALTAIMHPAVRAEIRRQIEAHAETDHVVVLDTPLMTETVTKGLVFAAVIVVDTPIEVAVERLVAPAACPRRTRWRASASRSRVKSASPGLTSSSTTAAMSASVDAGVADLWARLKGPSAAGPAVAS